MRKLLPHNIDNVRLALDLDGIASRHGLRVQDVTVQTSAEASSQGRIAQDSGPVDSVVISFSVVSQYPNFVAFLKDLEKSLRIVDVVSLSFTTKQGGALAEYDVSVKTYWLK